MAFANPPLVSEATAAAVHAAFPKGNLSVELRTEFGALYDAGVPVVNVQETSIHTLISNVMEENEGLHPRLPWKKSLNSPDN